MTVEVTPNDTGIPQDYLDLGAEIGYKPREPEDLRFLLLSRWGEGKTTFVSSIPDCLLLDIEGGAHSIPHGIATRIAIRSMEHYHNVVQRIIDDGKAGNQKFKRIVIDTGDELLSYYSLEISKEKKVEAIEEYGQKGAGWAILRRRFVHDLDAITLAGYSWGLVGHLQEKTVSRPRKGGATQEVTVFREVMIPSIAATIRRKTDYVFTVVRYPKTVTEKKPVTVKGISTTRSVTTTRDCYELSVAGTEDVPLRGKGRVPITANIVLPEKGGWNEFEKVYRSVVSRELKSY